MPFGSTAARATNVAATTAVAQRTGENTTVIDAFDKDDPFDATSF